MNQREQDTRDALIAMDETIKDLTSLVVGLTNVVNLLNERIDHLENK